MEMGRLRGLVSRERTAKRNGDGQVEGKHQQPHLPPLAVNQTSLPSVAMAIADNFSK